MNNKQKGTLYESMFKTEALKREIAVSAPEGDYLPYDVIVDNGKKLLRIQIKGTGSKQTSGYKVKVEKGNSPSRKRERDAFDVLAVVVVANGEHFWYLIPESAIGNNISIKVFLNPNSRGKYEKYKHGWDLIC